MIMDYVFLGAVFIAGIFAGITVLSVAIACRKIDYEEGTEEEEK